MQKMRAVMLMMALLVIIIGVAFAADHKGAADITLDGGKPGNVSFPHHEHQATLEKCDRCHGLFPQKTGIIDKMKENGQLKRMQVMGQCRGCHQEMTKAGKNTGPVSCKECHNQR